MSKMIQLRHVPDTLHQQLKARAALQGLSLSDFLIREARRIVERPTNDEIYSRLARRSRVAVRVSPAKSIRQGRDSR